MNNKKNIGKIIGFLVLLIFTLAGMPLTLASHRYHTSLTRMDYNSGEKTVEISIQLFTHDLIQVLEAKHKKRIDLEKTPEVNKLILNYLEQNFILKNSKGENARIIWVGKEQNVDVIWIYFEIPFEDSLEGKSLQNSIFFETYQEQTNIVICKFEQKKADLLFKAGEKIKLIQVGE